MRPRASRWQSLGPYNTCQQRLGHDLDVHENKKPVEIKVVSSNNRVSM
jgi:hypothetical protein